MIKSSWCNHSIVSRCMLLILAELCGTQGVPVDRAGARYLVADPQESTVQHNRYRALNQALNLVWNTTIADSASQFANTCPNNHVNVPYGENLYWSSSPFLNITEAIYLWWIEINQYDFANPGFNELTGHFTQIAWLESAQLGCGYRSDCAIPFGDPVAFIARTVYVCRYFVPGNVQGQFAANVLPINCGHWPYETQQGLQCVCLSFTVKEANGRCCPRFAVYNSGTNTCDCPAGLSYVNVPSGGQACCPANSAWVGAWDTGNCVCNSGFFWDGSICSGTNPGCPPFALWDGTRCFCPSGTYNTGVACCPVDAVWDAAASNCVCNQFFYWTGQACCPIDAFYDASSGACLCRTGFYWTGSQCCPFDAVGAGGGICACRQGFYWTGQACCPYDATFNSAVGACFCRSGFFWTGQACCPNNSAFVAGGCVCNSGFFWSPAAAACLPVS
eukprot:jgi/Botrbrau1/13328/Bobra.0334s0006.2